MPAKQKSPSRYCFEEGLFLLERPEARLVEEVVSRLRESFQKVASNKGAPGPDGMSIAEVRKHLDEL